MGVCRAVWRKRVLVLPSAFCAGFLFSSFYGIMFSVQSNCENCPTKLSQEWKVLTKLNIYKTGSIYSNDTTVPTTLTSSFLIPNKAVCSGYLTLNYVVVVHSAAHHFKRRVSIRRTWAKQSNHSRTVFLLGSTPSRPLQSDIYKENEVFGDIVQGTFVDDYKNLTLKAVMGLRWISENCRNAYYVIKVDDDVFVNMPQVIKNVFPVLEYHPKELICSVEPHAHIFRIGDPDKNLAKWLVRPDYFKGLERYPMPFCYGFAIFYKTSLAVDLFEMAKSTPFFPLDDVYVYGILASKLNGLTWRNAGELFYKTEETTLDFISARDKLYFKPVLLVGTANSHSVMQTLWHKVKNKEL